MAPRFLRRLGALAAAAMAAVTVSAAAALAQPTAFDASGPAAASTPTTILATAPFALGSVDLSTLGVPLADLAGAGVAGAAPASAGDGPNMLVVDDNRADCPNAQFARIQEAVDAAGPNDAIKVCPGAYDEQVTMCAGRRRASALLAGPAPGGDPHADRRGGRPAALDRDRARLARRLAVAVHESQARSYFRPAPGPSIGTRASASSTRRRRSSGTTSPRCATRTPRSSAARTASASSSAGSSRTREARRPSATTRSTGTRRAASSSTAQGFVRVDHPERDRRRPRADADHRAERRAGRARRERRGRPQRDPEQLLLPGSASTTPRRASCSSTPRRRSRSTTTTWPATASASRSPRRARPVS